MGVGFSQNTVAWGSGWTGFQNTAISEEKNMKETFILRHRLSNRDLE